MARREGNRGRYRRYGDRAFRPRLAPGAGGDGRQGQDDGELGLDRAAHRGDRIDQRLGRTRCPVHPGDRQVDGRGSSELGIGDGRARANKKRRHAVGTRSSCRDGERGVPYPVSAESAATRSAAHDPVPLGHPAGHPVRARNRLEGHPCYRANVEATLAEPLSGTLGEPAPLHARWLGRIDYREAHDLQKRLVDERAAGRIGDQLLLLEHPAVLTLGKNSDPAHILATPDELRDKGIPVERIERGGEVTYHGPGQLVAYPIVRLHERGLLVRPFVRALEAALVSTCEALGVAAARRDGHPGCWCDVDGQEPRKIGALGLRIERGVSYHGIALNVTVKLDDFALIDACGIPGVASTSIARELGRPDAPTTESVGEAAWIFARSFARAIDAPLAIGA